MKQTHCGNEKENHMVKFLTVSGSRREILETFSGKKNSSMNRRFDVGASFSLFLSVTNVMLVNRQT